MLKFTAMMSMVLAFSFSALAAECVEQGETDCTPPGSTAAPAADASTGTNGAPGAPGASDAGPQDDPQCAQYAQALENVVNSMPEIEKACVWKTSPQGKEIAKLSKQDGAEISSDNKDGDTSVTRSCDLLTKLQTKSSEKYQEFKRVCDRQLAVCNGLDEYQSQCSNINPQDMQQASSRCAKMKKEEASAESEAKAMVAARDANEKQCKKVAAGDSDESGDGKKADTDGSGRSADQGPSNKKSKNGGMGDGMGMAMQALGSMLPMMMNQNQDNADQQQPQAMQPVELSASDCANPANNQPGSSNYCICHPGGVNCMGATTAPANFNSQLPGIGGAAMTTPDGSAPNLSMNDPQGLNIPPPHDPGGAGGPSGMGGYAGGGGGMGGGHPNFTPDPPKGRGGSSLSADILTGVRGGSAAPGSGGIRNVGGFGSGGGGGGGGNHDPENMNGYKLNAHPDFRQFLPPGAGSLAGTGPRPGSPTVARTISGLDRIEGLHPSTVNMFTEMHSRYRMQWDSLYP